ncbi:MAG: hypothetical protein AB7G28_06940 [Pirellulales bacterium]
MTQLLSNAIRKYAAAIETLVGYNDADLIATLVAQGVDTSTAERTVRFVPVAFGRFFLDGMGISFDNRFFRYDCDGDVVESGRLQDEDVYAAATELAPILAGTRAFERIVFSSSEVRAVNDALKQGSKAGHLVTLPIAVCESTPTREGMVRIQEHLHSQLRNERSFVSRKPWWKVW